MVEERQRVMLNARCAEAVTALTMRREECVDRLALNVSTIVLVLVCRIQMQSPAVPELYGSAS